MKTNYRYMVLYILFAVTFSLSANAQIKPEMILVKGGSFQMGNPYTEQDKKGDLDEKPVHTVTVGDFYMGKFEVSVKEYKAYVASNPDIQMPPAPDTTWMNEHPDTKKYYPSPTKTWWGWQDNFPMQNVSWYDAVDYCNWLSEKEGLEKCYKKNADFGWDLDITKNGYRLPTEAEWEYAARGGSKTSGFIYSGSNSADEIAWFDETTGLAGPRAVGTKKPNELGIYDMSGNVWEWCSDFYSFNPKKPTDVTNFYISSNNKTNPVNLNPPQPFRVIRGGGWHYVAAYATVTSRDGPEPGYTNYNYGFRLVKTIK